MIVIYGRLKLMARLLHLLNQFVNFLVCHHTRPPQIATSHMIDSITHTPPAQTSTAKSSSFFIFRQIQKVRQKTRGLHRRREKKWNLKKDLFHCGLHRRQENGIYHWLNPPPPRGCKKIYKENKNTVATPGGTRTRITLHERLLPIASPGCIVSREGSRTSSPDPVPCLSLRGFGPSLVHLAV